MKGGGIVAYDYKKERQEAIAAGERALDSLKKAQNCLESAGNASHGAIRLHV